MPETTPNLGLKKPLGNEKVSRAAYNENLDLLDQNAVSAADVQQDTTFLALVQKHYKNVDLEYSYITQNAEKLVGSIAVTGDITATINYTYNAATNELEQEQVVVTAPFEKTITTTYTYDVDGDIDIEQRSLI